MSDMQTIFPEITVELSSGAISVKPFTFGQLPQVLKKARTVYGGVSHLLEDGTNEAAIILEIMAAGGEDLLDLVSLSINKPRSFFDTLSMDEGVKLIGAFLEVNLSFFVQKVLPQFKEVMGRLQAATGPMR